MWYDLSTRCNFRHFSLGPKVLLRAKSFVKKITANQFQPITQAYFQFQPIKMMRSPCRPMRNRQRIISHESHETVSVAGNSVHKKDAVRFTTPPNPKRRRKHGPLRIPKKKKKLVPAAALDPVSDDDTASKLPSEVTDFLAELQNFASATADDYSDDSLPPCPTMPYSADDDSFVDDVLPDMVSESESDDESETSESADDSDDESADDDDIPWLVGVSDDDSEVPVSDDGVDSEVSVSDDDSEVPVSDWTDFLSELRSFQWTNGLSEQTLKNLYKLLKKGNVADYLRSGNKLPEKHTLADKILRVQAGVEVHTYHGCPVCNEHIWDESDKGNLCPRAGCTGRRRDDNGQAYQEVIHFPLKSRLATLLGCPAWKHNIEYEDWRPQSKHGAVAGLL